MWSCQCYSYFGLGASFVILLAVYTETFIFFNCMFLKMVTQKKIAFTQNPSWKKRCLHGYAVSMLATTTSVSAGGSCCLVLSKFWVSFVLLLCKRPRYKQLSAASGVLCVSDTQPGARLCSCQWVTWDYSCKTSFMNLKNEQDNMAEVFSLFPLPSSL